MVSTRKPCQEVCTVVVQRVQGLAAAVDWFCTAVRSASWVCVLQKAEACLTVCPVINEVLSGQVYLFIPVHGYHPPQGSYLKRF